MLCKSSTKHIADKLSFCPFYALTVPPPCPPPVQVDVPSVEMLELQRLAPYTLLQHAPSRNRQYQLYTATERPDARSYPTRRVFVRGVVRQLTSPALLAASYSGNASAVVSAALEEVEGALSSALTEVARLQAGGPTGVGAVDWTHLFCHVLAPLPGGVGSSHSGAMAQQRTAEHDAKVAAALRMSAAGLVARHAAELRTAAVACIELRLRWPGHTPAWRVLISLPTGHEHGEQHVDVYREALRPQAPAPGPATPVSPVLVYSPITPHQSSGTLPGLASLLAPAHEATAPDSNQPQQDVMAGQPVLGPYPPLQPLQQRRLAARRHMVT